MKEKFTPGWFGRFEDELHRRVTELERDLIAEVMSSNDVEAEAIEIEGKTHRRVLRSPTTIMTGAGPVWVERWLYKDRSKDGGRSVSPLEDRLGIIEGFWTEKAAKNALWVVSQMTPYKAEELFKRMGNMAPSKSSLDRLPRALSDRWESRREAFEAELRESVIVPARARSVAVSLDGVMAPIDGGTPAKQVRARGKAAGKSVSGPAGYREVGCATLTFCDEQGAALGTIRIAHQPEKNKATLKRRLAAELMSVLSKEPSLRVVKLADGAEDNWSFLSCESLPHGDEAVDFFHACGHLNDALVAAYGHGTAETEYRFRNLRERLRDQRGGVDKVIRSLDYLRRKHPKRKAISRAQLYFRRHRRRMRYAELTEQGLPIGSGVVEAACKTVVAQRLKLSGMRWSSRGAHGVLTARCWDQSERFEQAWALLAATYQSQVTIVANVVSLRPPPRQVKSSRPSR